jgi:hypothetical protein
MDELDETLRRAARAPDATTPAGTGGRQPAPIDARLEGSMQSDSSSDRPAGRAPTNLPAGGDDSGLHDIRALAETTQRRSRRQPTVDPDEALLTTSSTSLRAIALPQPARTVALPMPTGPALARPARTAEGSAPVPRTDPPAAAPARRVWIAGAGLAGAAAVVAAVVIGGRGDAPVAAPAAPPVAAPAAAAPAAIAPAAVEPTAVAPTPVAPEPPPATAAATAPATETGSPTAALTAQQESPPAAGARISAAPVDKQPARPAAPRPAAERPVAAAAAPAPAAPPARAERGSQSLDDLLNDASGGAQRGAGGGAAAPAAPVKRELGRSDIKAAMSAVQGAARACYDRYGVAGTVGVKLMVASSGSVSKVQATGAFAGTPTGDCVAAAVEGARFPAWDGAPMTVQYSFLLSE